MFTGARRGEIENLRWSEINNDVAVLQDSKTGRKTIQLPAQVRVLLQGVPRRDGDPYVFGPGSRAAVRVRVTKLWAFIRQSIGRPDLRIHDLRHGYGTKGLELGESLHTMSKLLGHTDIESTMGYSHPSWKMLVAAARRVSGNMERRLNAKKDQWVPKGNVGEMSPSTKRHRTRG